MAKSDIEESRLRRLYRLMAYNTFNVILLMVAVNILLGGVFWIRDRVQKPASADPRLNAYRQKFSDPEAYSRISADIREKYLDEQDAMASQGFVYAPWVQFRNPSYEGAWLRTDAHGFRRTRSPVPRAGKSIRVSVFGGSTTFGYGVPDDHTIPSYLQQALEETYPTQPFNVRNFGQGYYYSSQEVILFLSLIKANDVPDWAIFVDGGNDTAQLALEHDEPFFSPAVTALWQGRRETKTAVGAYDWSWLPMGRLAQNLSRQMRKNEPGGSKRAGQKLIWSDRDLADDFKNRKVDYVVRRYLENKRITEAICREYGVRCLFVWQPHPAYKYDRTLHKRFPFKSEVPAYFTRVYERMAAYNAPNYLFLGAMLEAAPHKAYVDDVHYNEAVNEQIARRIAKSLDTR